MSFSSEPKINPEWKGLENKPHLVPAICQLDFTEFVRKHQLAVESLTEQQTADAIRQAIESGDFTRNVRTYDGAQTVTYIPGREADRLLSLYNELIYAVQSKHEGETRHETALRYIREREKSTGPDEPKAVAQ